MLHKDFSLEIKEVTESGTVEGYASVFGGSPDSYGDVVLPGAFADTLVKHKREGTMPLMLWGHQAGELPIGDWQDMAEDGKGLWVKGRIDVEDSIGARVHRALKRKSVRGLSIGYEPKQRETNPKKPGVNFLKEVDLWEVSLVNFPAQRRAQITSVKGDGELPSLDQFDEILREAGFSKSQRSVIAGKGFLHLLRCETGSASDDAAAFYAALGAHSPT